MYTVKLFGIYYHNIVGFQQNLQNLIVTSLNLNTIQRLLIVHVFPAIFSVVNGQLCHEKIKNLSSYKKVDGWQLR